jgi:hypothetical protein
MISEPCVIDDLSFESYHGQPTEGVSVSSSGLRTILLDCPAKYWATSPLNPSRVDRRSKAMDFGKAAHALILGEPQFNSEFIISPYDDFRAKDAREWRDEQTKIILKESDMTTIAAMAEALRKGPGCAGVFRKGRPEISLFWQDDATGIWLKSRPDWLPDDPQSAFLLEYKSARSINPRMLSAQAFQLGYDMQASMAIDLLHKITGNKPLGMGHACQEKDEPFLSGLYLFAAEQIEIGRKRVREALTILAGCLERHNKGDPPHVAWPGYINEPTYFITPKWLATPEGNLNVTDSFDHFASGFGN